MIASTGEAREVRAKPGALVEVVVVPSPERCWTGAAGGAEEEEEEEGKGHPGGLDEVGELHQPLLQQVQPESLKDHYF